MASFVEQMKSLGEEKVGQLAAKLLSNQKFVQGMQLVVSNSLEAKETLDRRVQVILGALGVPTAADHREIVERLEALERDLDEARDRNEALAADLAAMKTAALRSTAAKKKPAKKKPAKKTSKKKGA